MKQEILDATCGGRTIWLDGNKNRDDTLYIDRREEDSGFHGQEGRTYAVQPDEIQDFRDLPYSDEEFNHVVFDPPHEVRKGGMENLSGQLIKKYGALRAETWRSDLRKGFKELFRVLKPGGTLAFKFNDLSKDFKEVIDLSPVRPLYGTNTSESQNSTTRWFIFYKPLESDLT